MRSRFVAALLVLSCAAGVLAPCADGARGWIAVEYGAVVDRRQPSHSGEPVGVLLEKLEGRPLPAPGEHDADRTTHVLLDPLLEPYAFVLEDALDALVPPARALYEVGSLWAPGEAQPAWTELLRARSMLLLSDGQGQLRALVPTAPGVPDTALSEAAARDAWAAAWPVMRHALAAERRRLTVGRVEPTLQVDVFPFVHYPAETRFDLGTTPYHVAVADLRPAGTHPPLDLAALQRFLERGQRIEGARLEPDGTLRLFGSEQKERTQLLGQPLSLADLAVAYRAVFHGGTGEPYMSLDRGFAPETSIVNYGGRLRDTTLGLVALLCDVRFKTFSSGFDPASGRDVRHDLRGAIPGFRTHLERFAADARSAGLPGQQTRLWFYPDSVEALLSTRGDLLAIRSPRMSAASERVDAVTTRRAGEDPPWTRALTDELNTDYDALAARFPELAGLDEATRLFALFAWLRGAADAGLAVPELDALLALDLPPVATPRSYPQVLAVNALPPAGRTDEVTVFDRSLVVDALARLEPGDGRALPAAQRFRRALASLERQLSDHAALARELDGVRIESTSDPILDAQAYRAERLRMHRLALTLPAAQKDELKAANARGTASRVFSLGIGGLDLGLGATLARAPRSDVRLPLGLPGAGRLALDTAVAPPPASAPGQAAATPPAPRDAWRIDPAGLPAAKLPAHGGTAAPSGSVREFLYAADSNEPRWRRVTLDAEGRATRFERFDEGRRLAFRFEQGTDVLRAVALPAPARDPAKADEGASLAPGLVRLGVRAVETALAPVVTLDTQRERTATPLDVPRTSLQRLLLGHDLDASPGAPLAEFDHTAPAFAGAKAVLVDARPAARKPWDADAPVPGEQDPLTIGASLARWWTGTAGAPPVVASADPSGARWSRGRALRGAALLVPDDAFGAASGALRTALVDGWRRDLVLRGAKAPPPGTGVIVLASAEPPARLAARVRALARDPAYAGRVLAVLPLAGALRRDLPASWLAEGQLAAVGIVAPGPLGQPRYVEATLRFGSALNAANATPRRVEDVPSPFAWWY